MPETKPGGSKTEQGSSNKSDSMYQQNLFFVLLLSMTWQLAVAVLLPVLGGYYLDQYFGTEPVLLIIGVVVALLGVVGVMINIVRQANARTGHGANQATKANDKK